MDKLKIKNEIRMTADMYYSDAFKKLSRSAIVTLMRCLQKRKWEFERGRRKKRLVYLNEAFIFPYTEASCLGIAGTTQHCKNIKRLIEVGFLDLAYQGGWYQKNDREKDYSRYKLSERWRDYGTPRFKKIEKKKVLPKMFHIREHMARKELKVTSLKRREQLHKSEGDSPKTENYRLHKSEDDKENQKISEGLINTA